MAYASPSEGAARSRAQTKSAAGIVWWVHDDGPDQDFLSAPNWHPTARAKILK